MGTSPKTTFTVSELVPELPDRAPEVPFFPEQTAYVIYTSGSSGKPKGVAVSHESLWQTMAFWLKEADLGPDDRLLHVASLSFDAAGCHLYSALCSGATLCLSSGDKEGLSEEIRHLLTHRRITVSPFPAPVLAALPVEAYPHLRLVTSGGEALSQALVDNWATGERRFYNMYGPTEATMFSTCLACQPGRAPTIGRAIEGKYAFVCDAQLIQAKPGQRGELLLGGGLARSYLGRPGLTAERFVPDPFSQKPGERLYRTGDQAAAQFGHLTFFGRLDDQVKIRGYRIEPGEISSVLTGIDGVRAGAVVVVGKGETRRLVAHAVLEPGRENNLMATLRARLPPHMVPADLILHQQMPLTPNGKLDMPALVRLGLSQSGTHVPPRNPLEAQLAQLWCRFFQLTHLSVQANFFALGGNSLSAVRLIHEIGAFFGRDLPLSLLLAEPTIEGMARSLSTGATTPLGPARDWAREPDPQRACHALHQAQWGIWLGQQSLPHDTLFNISGYTRLHGALRPDLFEQAFRRLEQAQEAVRTQFGKRRDQPVQWTGPAEGETLTVVDLSGLSVTAVRAELLLEKLSRYPLVNGPLYRTVLLRLGPQTWYHFTVYHHLIADGRTMYLAARQLGTCYRALAAGDPAECPKGAPIAHIRQWEENDHNSAAYARNLDFWRKVAMPKPLYPRPEGTRPFHHVRRTIELPGRAWPVLSDLARASGRSRFQVLLTCWALCLYRATGRRAFVLGIPVTRRDPRLEETIGMFTGLLPLPLTLEAGASFSETLAQLGSLWTRFRAFRAFPSEEINAEPDFVLNYIDPRKPLDYGVTQADYHYLDTGHLANLALEVVTSHGGEQACFTLKYDPSLLNAVQAAALSDQWVELVTLVSESVPQECWPKTGTPLDLVRESASGRIPRLPACGDGPLSPGQRRLWLLEQIEGPSPTYNIPVYYQLTGPPAALCLETALIRLSERQDAMRTYFISNLQGEPRARIAPASVVALTHVDLSGLKASRRKRALQELTGADASRPFQLDRAPLFRATLLNEGRGRARWLWNMHHLIADGGSVAVINSELALFYREALLGEPATLDPLPVRYLDFAAWQQQRGYRREGVSFWCNQLANLPPLSTLSPDFARPARQCFKGAAWPFVLERDLSRSLIDLARELDATPFTLVAAALCTLLGRYNRRTDIALGTSFALRQQPELQPLVGLFLNTLVLRADLAGPLTPAGLVGRFRQTALAAFSHGDVDFERVIEGLNPRRDLSYAPLFQVLLSWQYDHGDRLSLSGLTVQGPSREVSVSRYDLTLFLGETEAGIRGEIEYNAQLYERATVIRFGRQLEALLGDFVAQPHQALDQLAGLSDKARRLLATWNATDPDHPPTDPLQLIQAAVTRFSSAPALHCGPRSLSYGTLWRRVQQLAAFLADFGAGPGELVAVCLPRSPELVVGLLAVLATGAAYQPLDPDFPEQRRDHLFSQGGARLLLTTRALKPEANAHCLFLEDVPTEGDPFVPRRAHPLDLAYVIFTSGSTGKPKGVQISRAAMGNFLQTMAVRPGLAPGDRLLALTTISFDIHVLELFLPLIEGGSVVLADHDQARDGRALIELMEQRWVDVIQATPATWQMLLDLDWEPPAALKMLCGGEALPGPLAARLTAAGATLWNMYGPTETTVWSAVRQVNPNWPARFGDVGRPVGGTRVYVLDQRLRILPIGMPGELCIAGLGLARGYHQLPAQTAARFVPEPAFLGEVPPGGRLYRSGDLVRFRADESGIMGLEFLGRLDHQIKLRGFRIEPGEIEQTLCEHPQIQAAVAAVVDDRLLAWYVADQVLEEGLLQERLRETLPSYMVPGALLHLSALPQTVAGKLDRAALPLPRPKKSTGRSGPSSNVEQGLISIWERLLDTRPVGVDDNFFDLGGNSLSGVRLLLEVERAFGRRLEMAGLFANPTVVGLGRLLEAADSGGPLSSVVLLKRGGKREPLFCIGGLHLYRELAERLVDRDVYGVFIQVEEQVFREVMGHGARARRLSLDEMVDHYSEQIQRVRPQGPYHLAGISFGGVLAVEVARKLIEKGETVAFVGLLDPILKTAVKHNRAKWVKHQVLGLLTHPGGTLKKISERLERRRGKNTGEQGDLMRARQAIYLEAVADYRPKPYPGRLTLFCARNDYPAFVEVAPELGWRSVAAGGMRVFQLDGTHLEILEEPHVSRLAELFHAELDQPTTNSV